MNTQIPMAQAGVFTWPYRVRFSDCDPAGIVFFPKYFLLINSVLEDWWIHIGHPWTQTITQERMGTPVAQLQSQFIRPSEMGDRLEFRLNVVRIGRSSLELLHQVLGPDGQERVRIEQRLVCTSLENHRPISWPQTIRAAISRFQEQP